MKKAKEAKQLRTIRNVVIGLVAFFVVGFIADALGFVPDTPTYVAPPAPGWEPAKVAAAEEYKVKALANIDEIVALHHCDDLITEVNIAASLGEQKGPNGLANDYIYNYAYSSAVTLDCDMRDVLK